MVIASSRTLEDIRTLEKYRPRALSLYETNEDGKKEEVFKVGTTRGEGSINQYGASFGSESHDDQKLATITMCIPQDTADAVAYAAEKVGCAVMMLNKIEQRFDEVLGEINTEKEAIRANITVAG